MKRFFKSVKGMTLRDLAPAAILLVIATIVTSIGSEIVGDIRDDQTTGCVASATNQTGCPYEYNISTQGLEGLETMGDWLPTIALVVAAVIVIGVIVTYFGKLGAGK